MNTTRPMAKIMVVEDESIVAKDLEMTLRRLGYAVPATASSADDALRKAGQFRPDLVLMDIHLHGEVDGITAARRLRSEMNIPVIYLTAYADDDTVERARDTEPFGYLLKPFNERELRSMLEVALYKHDAEARLRHSDRMASIGTMAAGIAHEINNPLAYVIANLDFAAKAVAAATADLAAPPPPPADGEPPLDRLRGASAAIDDAVIGADRVRKIVAEVSRFAHAKTTDREPVDLWDALESAIRLSSHHTQHHALIDLILCDLMMPRMNGMELYKNVVALVPDQASDFVFLCGGAVTQRAADFLEAHADQRFDKPFQLNELEAMIAGRLLRA